MAKSKPKPKWSLTPSGRVIYFAGVLLTGIGLKGGLRPAFIVGLSLLVPAIIALLRARFILGGLELRSKRPRVTRAFQGTPVEIAVRSERAHRELIVKTIPQQKMKGSLCFDRTFPNQWATQRGHEVYMRRGQVAAHSYRVSTLGPFDLSMATLDCGQSEEISVLPQIGVLKGRLLQDVTSEQNAAAQLNRRGMGSEIHQMRDWSPGDPLRRVHWRTSARIGSLMVKEMEEDGADELIVALGASSQTLAPIQRYRFKEAAIALVETILHRVARSARLTRLLLPSESPILIRRGSRSDLMAADMALCRLERINGWPAIALSKRGNRERCILVCPMAESLPDLPSSVLVIDTSRVMESGEFVLRTTARI